MQPVFQWTLVVLLFARLLAGFYKDSKRESEKERFQGNIATINAIATEVMLLYLAGAFSMLF